MRKTLIIWIPIAVLAVLLAAFYLRQWSSLARSIAIAHESQKNEIALLARANESLQDISALQMSLRVKLFGTGAAEEAVQSGDALIRRAPALPQPVITAMNRSEVKLVNYRQGESSLRVQFEGSYENLSKFLAVAGPDLPHIDGFDMERVDKTRLKLTLVITSRAA